MIVYDHKFGAGVQTYATPNKRALIITGGNFRVTDWLRD